MTLFNRKLWLYHRSICTHYSGDSRCLHWRFLFRKSSTLLFTCKNDVTQENTPSLFSVKLQLRWWRYYSQRNQSGNTGPFSFIITDTYSNQICWKINGFWQKFVWWFWWCSPMRRKNILNVRNIKRDYFAGYTEYLFWKDRKCFLISCVGTSYLSCRLSQSKSSQIKSNREEKRRRYDTIRYDSSGPWILDLEVYKFLF